MSTPISSSTPYCTNAQALLYVDARRWGDVLLDTNSRESPTPIGSDATLTELLAAASSEIEENLLKGGRYQVADLQALQAQDGNGAAGLRELTAVLAWAKGYRRRHPGEAPPAWTTWAYEKLEALATGQRILALQETADAGGIHHYVEQAVDVDRRDLLTNQAERFFGVRSNKRNG